MAVQELQQDKTLMKNDDVIKTNKCLHPLEMLIITQKGDMCCTQCKVLWFSEKNLLAELEKRDKFWFESMGGLTNEIFKSFDELNAILESCDDTTARLGGDIDGAAEAFEKLL